MPFPSDPQFSHRNKAAGPLESTYANIDSVIVGNRPLTDLQPESQAILTGFLAGLCPQCGKNPIEDGRFSFGRQAISHGIND